MTVAVGSSAAITAISPLDADQAHSVVTTTSLPNRLLLGLAENLVLADPAPARLGHECLTSARQPLRPPVVHAPE
ncbi:hypothetical protein [Streptomyces venetus]|uniref:hypothetical protein n=1 Tax=Streptomyces venetus TaxID=1701086 RepID=UPI0031EE2531